MVLTRMRCAQVYMGELVRRLRQREEHRFLSGGRGAAYHPQAGLDTLAPGTFYLEGWDESGARQYKQTWSALPAAQQRWLSSVQACVAKQPTATNAEVHTTTPHPDERKCLLTSACATRLLSRWHAILTGWPCSELEQCWSPI